VELVLLGAERTDPQTVRQLDAGQVVDVLAVALERLCLELGAAEQRRTDARAFEQQRDGGAKRARADDDGATRVLAGVAEGRTDPGKLPASRHRCLSAGRRGAPRSERAPR